MERCNCGTCNPWEAILFKGKLIWIKHPEIKDKDTLDLLNRIIAGSEYDEFKKYG